MEKIKIGVIGLGGIAQLVHLPNLKKLNNVELVSVAEINKSRLNAVADKFKVPERYTDYNELLAKSDVEAVIIATPTNTHKEISLACIKAKKDILVEKPFTRTLSEAKPVVEAAKKNKCKIMVGFNLRYRPDAMLLKTMINSGEIGDPVYVKANWVRRQSSGGKWFTRKTESGGGVIIDLGILLLDLSLWLMNFPPVTTVSTQNYSTVTKGVEDTSVSLLRCKNSSIISLESSWSLPLDRDTFNVTVFGTKGSASLNPFKVVKKIDDRFIELSPPKAESAQALFQKSYSNELKSFIGAVRGINPVISSGEEVLFRMKIVEAMYKSALQNGEVKLK